MSNLSQEDDQSITRLSTHHHHHQSLPHQFVIKNLERGKLTYGGGSTNGGVCKVNKVDWLSGKHFN
jgi:hypothetical protein